MPISIHDIFTELVVREIWSQLENVAREDKEIVIVIDLIKSIITSDVYLYGYNVIDKKYLKHTPNVFFAYADSQYSFVVIEISYSQRHKDLVILVNNYICGSDGNISVVLGLDIEYGVGFKRASVSIWRPRLASDPENEIGVFLEMVSIQEVDVMPVFLSLIEIFAKKMLINLVFGNHFEPMTESRFKVMDYRSSFVILRQGLASLMCLKVLKA